MVVPICLSKKQQTKKALKAAVLQCYESLFTGNGIAINNLVQTIEKCESLNTSEINQLIAKLEHLVTAIEITIKEMPIKK